MVALFNFSWLHDMGTTLFPNFRKSSKIGCSHFLWCNATHYILFSIFCFHSYHSCDLIDDESVINNSQIQLKALDLLITLTSDLTLILADSPKGFPQYMVDLLTRCKVDKTCLFHLQCLLQDRSAKLAAIGEPIFV